MALSKHVLTERIEEEIDKYTTVRVYLRDDNREFAIEICSSKIGDDHVQIRALGSQLVIVPMASNAISVTVED